MIRKEAVMRRRGAGRSPHWSSSTTPASYLGYLRALEGSAARLLRLEHAANVYPLVHVGCYYLFFVLALWPGAVVGRPLRAALWLLIVLLGYSLSVGVLHMHAHRKVFVSSAYNRLLEMLLCFPSLLTCSEMLIFHVGHHHANDNAESDVGSTLPYARGWRAVWYWLRYSVVVRFFTIRAIYGARAPRKYAVHRLRFALDLGLAVSLVALLTIRAPTTMLLYWFLPSLITRITGGYFAWLTHAPAGPQGSLNGSINNVNNWMGFFIFNQGYHQVHHCYPGIHWTEIPDRLEMMLEIDPQYIVPYWVTLHSVWRIGNCEFFRNRPFGERWQARYREKAARSRVRLSWCPHFAWI